MAQADSQHAKRAKRDGKCNSYLHFVSVAAHSAMGLRIGDDETYKFQPPVTAQRTRSKRKAPFASRRSAKNESVDNSSRSTKSAASDLKGFIMHIASNATSTHTTSYNTSYNSQDSTPRASIGSRPASQASFTPSMSGHYGDVHSKKWWHGRNNKRKEPSRSGRQTPAFFQRGPGMDIWVGKEHKQHDEYNDGGQTPTAISEPYNFQHHMHLQPHQVRRLADASQNDLIAEFSAMRAAQNAKHPMTAPDAPPPPSRVSYMALTQSVPDSFQVTARSSMHAPEPVSPRSDQAVHYVGSKGSFSIPFKDGKSPRLHQQPSVDLAKPMTISEDTIMEDAATQVPTPPVRLPSVAASTRAAISTNQPLPPRTSSVRRRDPRGENLCSHCHSRVIEEDEIAQELEGSPIEDRPKPELLKAQQHAATTGQKSSFFTSAEDSKEDHDFKELHHAPRSATQNQPLRKQANLTPALRPVDEDEVRVSMNRSSINGGLFSSWAAASESSDDGDGSSEQVSGRQEQTPQQRIANRLKQRAAKTSKAKLKYRPPATPPPILPLPSPPPNQAPLSKQRSVDHARDDSRDMLNNFAAIQEEDEVSDEADDAKEVDVAVADGLPERWPSAKNVRFKSDDTLINGQTVPEPPCETSLHRVKESLDDLQENLSRLEVDLSRRPSQTSKQKRAPSNSSKHSPKSSDSSQGSSTRHHKTPKVSNASSGHRRQKSSSGSASKATGLPERRSSRGWALANQPIRSKNAGVYLGSPPADISKIHGPLPPLPSQAKVPLIRPEERHYSTGSATIPASIAVQ